MNMNRTAPAVVAAILAMALGPAALNGQVARGFFGAGVGMVSPRGTFGDEEQLGWQVFVTAARTLKGSVALMIDGSYAHMGHKNDVPGKATLGGGTAGLALYLSGPTRSVRPFVTAGAGAYAVTVDVPSFGSARATKLALAGGVGVLVGSGSRRGFVLARYISVATSPQKTKFLPISAGLMFPLGLP